MERKKILNLTIGVIIAFFSVIPVLISFLVQFHSFLKNRHKHVLLFSSIFLAFTGYTLFQGLSVLFMAVELFHFSYIAVLIAGYLLICFVDIISRESIDPKKNSLVTGLVSISAILSFQPNTFSILVYPNGQIGYKIVEGFFLIFLAITVLIVAIFVMYFSVQLLLNAPSKKKKYSLIYLIGNFIFGFLPLLSTLLELYLIVPNLHLLILAVGGSMISLAFKLDPEIAFILPFKVNRLIIMEINTGISIFHYNWVETEDYLEQSMYMAMIQAVGNFIERRLHSGSIREIKLEKNILILKKDPKFPIVYVLETNKFSRSLRNGLDCFANAFINKYSQYFSNPQDINKFNTASELIGKCFSFIPY